MPCLPLAASLSVQLCSPPSPSPAAISYSLWLTLALLWLLGFIHALQPPSEPLILFQQLTHHSPAAHPARLISGQSSTPSTSILHTPMGPSFVQFSDTFLSCLLAFAHAFTLPGTMHCASPSRSQPKHQFFLER